LSTKLESTHTLARANVYNFNYYDELCRAMIYLAREPKVIFMGQAVAVKGTAMSNTLVRITDDRKIELPVAEEMQMGMSIGMALAGFIPVSFYPRWNFLLLAANQLVGHLDKLSQMSQGGYKPKIIIRTSIGATEPLHPQCQHVGDFTEAFKLMLTTVEIIRLNEAKDIFPAYQKALERTDGRSTILVEWGSKLNEK
jgi:pyruvate/2-oxoglutarate/acetoin dehydrogenase E1 component